MFVFIFGVFAIPSSYAEPTTVNVDISHGSSTSDCEKNNVCFNPFQTTIDVFSTVMWKNSDTTTHTVTSTNPTVITNNIFNSELIISGDSFSQKFEQVGTFGYSCTIHPWMIGVITVQDTFDKISDNSNQESNDGFPFSGFAVIVIPFTDDSHDCKELQTCFRPMDLIIEKDTLVVWHNADDAPRSIISGNPIDGPDGVFESGMMDPGESFSYRFETQTIHEYYDKLYHWETGTITVTGKIIDKQDRMTILEGMSADGTINVDLEVMNPTEGKAMGIHAKFTDNQGNLIKNLNYDLISVQNGQNVLTIEDNFSNAGIEEHWTDVLESGDPVDVKITLLGIGMPGSEHNWTGPRGDVIMFNVVPEFGTIAMMILVVSIVSVVGISAKSKLSLKL